MTQWMRDDVKHAKASGEDYRTKHKNYSVAVQKIKQINRDSKVQLSELAAAEKKRDHLKDEFVLAGIVSLHNIKDVYLLEKMKFSRQLCEYADTTTHFLSKMSSILNSIEDTISEGREWVLSEENTRTLKQQELQLQIAQYSHKETFIEDYNPDLMNENEVIDTFDSIIPWKQSFVVRRDGSQKKVFFLFDLKARNLSISYESGRESDQEYKVDDILYIDKGLKNFEKTLMTMIVRGREDKPESYIFSNHAEREHFYELYWLARRGLAKTFLADSKRPISHEDLKIWCGTWNMGDAQPEYHKKEALENWMPQGKFDIYVISTQESIYNPRTGYLSPEDDLWAYLRHHLGEAYIKLASVSLQHIRLACFVRRDHYYKICRVKTGTVATGLAGVIGNKGGCSISFELYDNRICFVGSHLAARIDRRRLEARNQNYRDILKGLASGVSKSSGTNDIHHEFDLLVWLGDLNYRIELSRDEIIERIKLNDLAPLKKSDQLLEEMKNENCFIDFNEMEINFSPTYRFNRGDRTWSEEKMREPAWCDRVLWKPIKQELCQPLSYTACHDLVTSDHSPVSATFGVSVALPSYPHIRDSNCKIVISNLSGLFYKLTRGCYVIFQAPWLSNYTTSVYNDKTSNPTWNERVVLYPAVTNRSYLTHQWIRIVIKESKQDVCLGQGVILLDDAIEKTTTFKTRIVDKSRVFGFVEGTVSVEFSETYKDPFEYDPIPHSLKSTFEDKQEDQRPSFSIESKQAEHIQLDGTNDENVDQKEIANSPVTTGWSFTRPNISNVTNLAQSEPGPDKWKPMSFQMKKGKEDVPRTLSLSQGSESSIVNEDQTQSNVVKSKFVRARPSFLFTNTEDPKPE